MLGCGTAMLTAYVSSRRIFKSSMMAGPIQFGYRTIHIYAT